jgi:hypothetical protein
LYQRQKSCNRNRLDHYASAACVDASLPDFIVIVARKGDGLRRHLIFRAQPRQNIQAVAVGKRQIQEHQVRPHLGRGIDCSAYASCDRYLTATLFE